MSWRPCGGHVFARNHHRRHLPVTRLAVPNRGADSSPRTLAPHSRQLCLARASLLADQQPFRGLDQGSLPFVLALRLLLPPPARSRSPSTTLARAKTRDRTTQDRQPPASIERPRGGTAVTGWKQKATLPSLACCARHGSTTRSRGETS
jgi:hypothetical protein